MEHGRDTTEDAPDSETRVLGRRTYTEAQFERIIHENRAAAAPIAVEIGAAVLFAAIVSVLFADTGDRLDGLTLILVGVLFAVVPAAIWLAAFYRQDHREPEPKHYVIGVFALGAVLAEAIGQPLIRDLFRVQDWLYAAPLTGILGSIFVIGVVQEFLKYAAVRYTVYRAAEFDERVDGIIYGAAAGLGYATMLNLRYVIGNGGVDLGVGAVQVSVNALAQASFAGVTGYFLGRAKFERMGPLWLPFGLSFAAALNGVTSYLLREIPGRGGLGDTACSGLVVAAIVAAATFATLFAVIRRLNAAARATIGPVANGSAR